MDYERFANTVWQMHAQGERRERGDAFDYSKKSLKSRQTSQYKKESHRHNSPCISETRISRWLFLKRFKRLCLFPVAKLSTRGRGPRGVAVAAAVVAVVVAAVVAAVGAIVVVSVDVEFAVAEVAVDAVGSLLLPLLLVLLLALLLRLWPPLITRGPRVVVFQIGFLLSLFLSLSLSLSLRSPLTNGVVAISIHNADTRARLHSGAGPE